VGPGSSPSVSAGVVSVLMMQLSSRGLTLFPVDQAPEVLPGANNWRSRIAVAGGEHGIGLDGVAEYLFGA
jgi:hypothetical protein